MIPTELTSPRFKPDNQHWLLYGKPKIGKSALANSLVKAMYIPTEPGATDFLKVYSCKPHGFISSWPEFVSQCTEIKMAIKKDEFKFNAVIIDTIEMLGLYCTDWVVKDLGVRALADTPKGKGFTILNHTFRTHIAFLMSLTKVIFISHLKETEVTLGGEKVTHFGPNVGGGWGSFIQDVCPIIGFITHDASDSKKRIIHFRSSNEFMAGDKSGRLDPVMDYCAEGIKNKMEEKKNG